MRITASSGTSTKPRSPTTPIGAGAHGKHRYYRYYVCRTQQTKGQRGCHAQRVPAEPLETAVIDALVDTYNDLDHFQQALAAARAHHDDDRPRLEAELAATTAQIRDTTAALDRYLRAFETASMPQQVCAARVEDLAAQRDELAEHRDQLTAALNRTPHPPGRDHLEYVAVTLRDVIDEGSPHLVKDLLAGLIAESIFTPSGEHSPSSRRQRHQTAQRPANSMAGRSGHVFVWGHETWSRGGRPPTACRGDRRVRSC